MPLFVGRKPTLPLCAAGALPLSIDFACSVELIFVLRDVLEEWRVRLLVDDSLNMESEDVLAG